MDQQTVTTLLLHDFFYFYFPFLFPNVFTQVLFVSFKLSHQREDVSSFDIVPEDSGMSLYSSIHTYSSPVFGRDEMLQTCNKTSDRIYFTLQGGGVCVGLFLCLILHIWSSLLWLDLMYSRFTSRTRSDTSSPTSTL